MPAVLLAGGAAQLLRPLPALRLAPLQVSSYVVPGSGLDLPWPATGQASLFLAGTGWVGQTPGQDPVAIASVTKLMTALLVLQSHPLLLGQSGPSLTVTAADLALYQQEVAQGDSVVKVAAGESLSEFQLLEGLLLPSGDNFAALLATWAAGSESAFVARMNQTARSLGMRRTVFADASGLSSATISTASDLVRLAEAVMAQPVLAQIVAMPTAVLPLAGTVRNYDYVLGQQGVVGIKTGWTAAAGGCFVFAARRIVAGRPAELLGAVLAQPGNAYTGIVAAEQASLGLLAATWPHLEPFAPVAAGQRVGTLTSQWHSGIPVRAAAATSFLAWPGLSFKVTLVGRRWSLPLPRGSVVARVVATSASGVARSSAATSSSRLGPPGLLWRMARF